MKFFSEKKDGISLKLFVAIVIIVICSTAIGIYALISQKICYKQYKENMIEDVYKHTELIENHLSNDEEDMIKLGSDVELLALVYGGRILVVDKDYKIQNDSYGLCNGNYIVSKNIIEAMNGSDEEIINEKNDYIQYIRKLDDSEGNDYGLIIVHISRDKINSMDETISVKLINVFLILIILCVVIACFISSFSVRDLRYMNNQMDIAQNGHLDEPIK